MIALDRRCPAPPLSRRPSPWTTRALAGLLPALPLLAATYSPAQQPAQASQPSRQQLAQNYGRLPLAFEPNRGQTDSAVQYLSRGDGYSLYLTPGQATLQLRAPAAQKHGSATQKQNPAAARLSTLTMQLVGGNPAAAATPEDKLPGTVNYFLGNDPAHWHTALPTYQRVAYTGVYPGIDLVYYGNQRQLEYDFVVAPQADPARIHLAFTGASPRIDSAGDLVLSVPAGETRFHAPVVYQLAGTRREPVAASFQLAQGGQVGFSLGAYDHTRPLVIDPVLSYLTYLGGSNNDQINGLAVDSAGEAIVTGYAYSTDFPLQNPYSSTPTQNSRNASMFVTKFNAAGTALVYSTYLGQSTIGNAVATDSAGNAYAFATTNDPNYPVTPGAFQTLCGANYDNSTGARVTGCSTTAATGNNSTALTKLSADGSQLLYSTFLSGNDANIATGVAVNAAGEAYVTGLTNAYCPAPPYNANGTGYQAYSCFPVTPNAANSSVARGSDTMLFLTKFNASGTGLIYSTVLANQNPVGHYVSGIKSNAIALDPAGNAYITGSVGGGYFITTTPGAFQTAPPANSLPAFVAKFNPAGTAATSLVYSTYLTGTLASNDVATAIAADSAGNAYVTGYTNSCTFPTTTGAFSTVPGGYVSSNICAGGFLTKLNPAGSGLVWSTYTGNQGANGRNNDDNDVIALASDSSVYVAGDEQGVALSPTVTPLFTQNESHFTYIKHFSADGASVLFSSAIGGTTDATSIPTGLALDPAGNFYLAGYTNSATWPTTTGAFQRATKAPGYSTSYLVKIAPTLATTTTLTLPTGVTAGQPAIFTAKVAGPTGTTAIPTGTVTFASGSTTLGTGTLNSSGVATYTASFLNGTTYSVTASYPGDSTFSPSVSTAASLVVTPATPTITLTAPASAAPGASVTLTAKVTGSGGSPTGTIIFKDGPNTLATVALASGSASYTSTAFALGPHSLTATYSGDSIFATGMSPASILSVALFTPTVTLTAPATALTGASVTLSAAVASTSGTPTGTVTFKDGATTLSTVNLSSGAASYTTSAFTVGTHTLTAVYSGDTTFSAVTSAASTLTVNVPPAVSFSATPTSLTITRGQSGTSVFTATPVGGYTGTVTFACGSLPTGASCTFNPTTLTLTGNNATASTTLTLATTSAKTGAITPGLRGFALTGGILSALLLMPLTLRRRNLTRGVGLLALLLTAGLAATALTGCGSSSNTVTVAPGAYTVPVLITAGGSTTTINLNVTVQ